MVLLGLCVLPGLVWAQTLSVTLTAAQHARLQALATARGEPLAQVAGSVLVAGMDAELGTRSAHALADVQAVIGVLTPQAQAEVVALAQSRVPPGAPGTAPPAPLPPGTASPVSWPGPEGTTLGAFAGGLLGLGGVLGWGWDVVQWVLWCMGIFLTGYLAWEFWPCRRLLWGVTRRLYGRSLED
jgi:hypothetical protein